MNLHQLMFNSIHFMSIILTVQQWFLLINHYLEPATMDLGAEQWWLPYLAKTKKDLSMEQSQNLNLKNRICLPPGNVTMILLLRESWILSPKKLPQALFTLDMENQFWDELKDRFKQSNGPHVYQLRKELVTTNQGTLSVEACYTKLKTIWQNLCDYPLAGECSCGGINKLLEHSDS